MSQYQSGNSSKLAQTERQTVLTQLDEPESAKDLENNSMAESTGDAQDNSTKAPLWQKMKLLNWTATVDVEELSLRRRLTGTGWSLRESVLRCWIWITANCEIGVIVIIL